MGSSKPKELGLPLGTGSGIPGLISYYRENGESEFVAKVEEQLTPEPEETGAITERAGVSYNYARKALEYLAVEGRAERHVKRVPARPFKRVQYRYLWSLPSVTKSAT